MLLVENFVELFMESAPWLLLGFVIAGLMKMFIPGQLLARHLGQPGLGATIKAALIGAPLPLCSCGVIPAAMGLRRSGASKAATTSFMISTPETGVDSISLSYALLGPFMAVIRPIAAITSAIVAGVLTGPEHENNTKSTVESGATQDKGLADHAVSCCSDQRDSGLSNPVVAENAASSCCSGAPVEQATPNASCGGSTAPVQERAKVSCCGTPAVETEAVALISTPCCSGPRSSVQVDSGCSGSTTKGEGTFLSRVVSGLQFTFFDLVKDIAQWLMIGLLFAAIVKTYVPTEFLAQWGSGFTAFVVMALVGVPMYICATASTPIAAGLLFSGVSPGAVLVFMLAGPATNIATIGLVKKELGNRALSAYLFGVMVTAMAFGYLTNFLAERWQIDFYAQASHAHELVSEPVAIVSSVVLALFIARAFMVKAGWLRG